ncbi:unnamed protein product [Rhizophagus irregularis]|nr:unnamed protein product [Rhizophagus irregularis]
MTEQTFKAFESYDFENDIIFSNFSQKKLNTFIIPKLFKDLITMIICMETNTKKSVSSNIEDNTVSTSRETSVRDVNNNPQTEQAADNPQYPRTFHQLVEMISKEQPIPGIKQIPNELNKGTPSNPTIKPRPKRGRKKYE